MIEPLDLKLRLIIPLAAPVDSFKQIFERPKPLCPVTWAGHIPLIRYILKKRGYSQFYTNGVEIEAHVGIRHDDWTNVKDSQMLTDELELALPGSKVTWHYITRPTQGAADTVGEIVKQARKSGVDKDWPVVVDLCDLDFSPPADFPWWDVRYHSTSVNKRISANSRLLVFQANHPKYSYAKLNGSEAEELFRIGSAEAFGTVEKVVTPPFAASLGVYCFRDLDVIEEAIKKHMADDENCVLDTGVFFMCPVLNESKPISVVRCSNVYDLGTPLHLIDREKAVMPDYRDPQHALELMHQIHRLQEEASHPWRYGYIGNKNDGF